MPKRSKKSKSKRITLKQKHKVIKKVRDHHKKKNKEAKKLGLHKRPKVEKDPGIPNDWPFKEQELKALEARWAKALEESEQKKVARKERARLRKLGLLGVDDSSNPADATPKKATGCPKIQDESMASEDDDATEQKLKLSTSKQSEKLYAAEGILNTTLQKAEKKRRKKGVEKPTSTADNPISVDEDDDENGDYDFKVDYKKKVSFVDLTEEEKSGSEDDDNEVSEQVPMAGVEVDN